MLTPLLKECACVRIVACKIVVSKKAPKGTVVPSGFKQQFCISVVSRAASLLQNNTSLVRYCKQHFTSSATFLAAFFKDFIYSAAPAYTNFHLLLVCALAETGSQF